MPNVVTLNGIVMQIEGYEFIQTSSSAGNVRNDVVFIGGEYVIY
jgi:hypothetical protein